MKTRVNILSLCLCFVGMLFCENALAIEVKRLEPTCWWVGMKNRELQLMVYGPNIAASRASINYQGVTLKNEVRVENQNYLFLYLDIAPETSPGTMDIVFTEGKKTLKYKYELKARNTKPGAQGFSTEDVLYLITPDRFANGDPSNDTAEGATVTRERPSGRHGGDIKGVTDHLDYLSDLGVTTIWLNPVQKNSANSYHGYAISDFYDVDPRFGTMEEYIDMIDKIHDRGMKVVMDMILNHCGGGHWWMQDLPTGDWLNFNNQFVPTSHLKWTVVDPHAAPSERKLFSDGWFTRGMPDLNQRNPLLSKYLIQSTIWWIEYARIDGIRQDTHPYMEPEFSSRWCKELTEEYPDFNIAGETWYPSGSGFLAWWQRNSRLNADNPNLKTVMDFNFAFLSQTAFEEPNAPEDVNPTGLFNIYVSLASDFLYEDMDNVLMFLDNHDMGRFSEVEDVGLNKYKQGIGFLLTTRGIPQIYYGTELLFKGKKKEGDGVIRKEMPGGWPGDERSVFTKQGRTDEENEAYDYMSRLLHWRKTSEAVKHGKLIQYAPVHNHGDCYVYARIKGDETVLVVMGGSDKDVEINMSRYTDVTNGFTKGVDVITGKELDITGTMKVPARGTYILELKK